MNKRIPVRNTPYYDSAQIRAFTPQPGAFQQPLGMPMDFGGPAPGAFGAPPGGAFPPVPAGGAGGGGGGGILGALFGGGGGPPAAGPAGGAGGAIPGLLNSLSNIRQIIDRMGGIDGVLENVQKAQKIMGTLQQMGPMVKLLFGSLKKSNNSDGDEAAAPRRRRRRRRRRSNSSRRRR